MGKGGKFVRIEGEKFDIILNILVGIRRALSSVVRLPGQELTEYQYRKKMSTESDWIDQTKLESKARVRSFKFTDYAPMVFAKQTEVSFAKGSASARMITSTVSALSKSSRAS